jgi:GH24 family phage-related lysozyme (muramidase)
MITLKVLHDTWFKRSPVQHTALPLTEVEFAAAGVEMPIAAYRMVGRHYLVTLGKDETGEQVSIKGLNTWYVFEPDVVITGERRSINAAGLALIKEFEGLRLTAYQDSVGVWTIGWGTTSGVTEGMTITEAQAEEFLKQDLIYFEDEVSRLVKVAIDDNEFSALVSFAYNLGSDALANSTLLKLLNRGNHVAAAAEFEKWDKAGGAVLSGLERRRKAERSLFVQYDA